MIFQESIGNVARQQKGSKRKSIKEKFKIAQSQLERLRRIIDDVRKKIQSISIKFSGCYFIIFEYIYEIVLF